MTKFLGRVFIAALLIGFLNAAHLAFADRNIPKVDSIMSGNVKYSVSIENAKSRKQRGGYIEAWEADKKLWELQVYNVDFDPNLDSNIQEVYITSLKIENGKLIVTNELEEVYEIDLTSKAITKVQNSATQVKK